MRSSRSKKAMKRSCYNLVLLLALWYLILRRQAYGQSFDYPTANLTSIWTADHNGPHNISYSYVGDSSFIKAILLRSNPTAPAGPNFACGFYCKGGGGDNCTDFLFAIFIVTANSGGGITNLGIPQVVWSANRHMPVRVGAVLQLTAAGDLVLLDSGSVVWSTGTSGKSVAGLSLEPSGNLRLVDGRDATVWQSFDHPSGVLLSGQVLSGELRLVPNVSVSSWMPNPILFLSAAGAYANATPPQSYYNFSEGARDINSKLPCHIRAAKNTFVFVANINSSGDIISPPPSPLQFLRFEYDGHLRLIEWADTPAGWAPTADVFDKGNCAYPTVCGSYGICSDVGNNPCKCPAAAGNSSIDSYFTTNSDPNLGDLCNQTAPLTCQPSELHQFLPLQDVDYFNPGFVFEKISTAEGCKNACSKNCSCKAAILHYGQNASDGTCYLPTKLFSLMTIRPETSHYNSTTFLKVQPKLGSTNPQEKPAPVPVGLLVGLSVGSFVALVLVILVVVVWLKKKKSKAEPDDEDDEANQYYQLPGLPTRFSYQDLTIATENFIRILGKGGFATVFEGTLPDGIKVAVKRLEGVQQIAKEFLAEVQIIGRIHHINLVKLVGFCTERSHKLLLYEYMGNGSLDRWIFNKAKGGDGLNWELRKRIIYQVAKGLMYLHDECSPNIIHLDIKPQNILLDDDFNAKISDFGLSKLIDTDQSFVMTTMRGTPGYLAPEWLVTSKITDKVDVFSFGVVLVEVVCQRRNLESTQTGDTVHLLKLLNSMAGEGQLTSFIESYCNGAENHELEAMQMLKLAIWCLQSDANQRPSMSTVVKVLEETMEVPDLELNFLSHANRLEYLGEIESSSSAPLMASALSGPR